MLDCYKRRTANPSKHVVDDGNLFLFVFILTYDSVIGL